MRNFIFSFILFIVIGIPTHLQGWEVINTDGGTMVFSNESFANLPMQELQTERDKKGKHLSDNWKGFLLKDWMKKNGYTEFGEIVFESSDHYQVRLTKEELDSQTALVALYQNGNLLESKDIRLILPNMRDMYWISNITTITLQTKDQMIIPNIIYWAEPILNSKGLKTNIAPFTNMKGYAFTDLLDPNIPFPDGNVLVMGVDGVRHLLDYRKYLQKAVIEKTDENSFLLKSPDMPAGMWIKDLAYVQFNTTGLLFTSVYKDKSFQNLADILSWKNTVAFIPTESDMPDKIRSWENKELELKQINLSNQLFLHYLSIELRVK
jgi:hypothetical protein